MFVEMKLLLVNFSDTDLSDFKISQDFLHDRVSSIQQASEKFLLYEYDCLVIKIDKIEVECYGWLRQFSENNRNEGLIFLSTNDALEYKLSAFELGVDDYLVLPMHSEEIIARIKSVTRRKKFQSNSKIYIGNVVIDLYARTVFVWDRPLKLTKTEYDILLHLHANKLRVVSKELLAEYLWGDDVDNLESFNILFAHIKNLRKKLLNAKSGVEIKNVYKVGYQIIEL